MREIKFRAWDKKRNKMLPVWEIGWKTWDRFQVSLLPINYVKVEDNGTYDLQEHEVELMQFTGLHDSQGKEIWEGDIVRCGDNGEYFPQEYDEKNDDYKDVGVYEVVGPTDTYPSFEIEPNPAEEMNGLSYALADGNIEVIGNIFENPELLGLRT